MPSDNIYAEKSLPGAFQRVWRLFYRDTAGMIGMYGFILLLLLCLTGHWIAPYSPGQQFNGYHLLPPSWSHYGEVAFFLGTDDLGRDMLSRLLNGAAATVGSAIIVTLCAILVAFVIGAGAALSRGIGSALLHHLFDAFLVVPSLLLAIIIIAFTGPQLSSAILAVWLALLPRLVRAIRIAVREELNKEYIMAARLDGAGRMTILRYAVLPNILPALVNEITRALSIAIFDIAALGFLGLGAQLPSTEWGSMLGNALELIYIAPWTIMLPGAAITFSVLIVNVLGDAIRRAIVAGVE